MADQRDRRFKAERTKQAKRLTRIQRDTAGEVTRLLTAALASVKRELALAPSPTEWQAWHLPNLQQAVQTALAEMERAGAARLATAGQQAWSAGVDFVDKPIEAALRGVSLSGALGTIDTRQLTAMRAFMTDRIRDISTSVANRINGELGLMAIGAKTQGQAADVIQQLVAGGRRRATTIIRTELGRAYSTAAQARLEQATTVLPGLKKQWRRSGKVHSRPTHDQADGQVQPVDEPFIVGGVAIMFPRDPAAPPAETINCGCTSLPFMEGWDVSQPGRSGRNR